MGLCSYNVEFLNVRCYFVDWEKDIFILGYRGHFYCFTPIRRISQSSDLDHIYFVCKQFKEFYGF